MPFYILRDFADPIMAQLDFEEKGEIFYYVQSKLKRDVISDLLKRRCVRCKSRSVNGASVGYI